MWGSNRANKPGEPGTQNNITVLKISLNTPLSHPWVSGGLEEASRLWTRGAWRGGLYFSV